ncbi:Ala-tRNA(Pro) deacylase [Planomicrobium soli]|uniref:Ala-tRNA(Pro) deacylase n=1 Tax=Planomicrobium soli TaxID=1176648 RepID=A0A2P8H3Y2_9BACL|nr:YbaK/EbsC family protein [Planomicrobium soli]PSL40909.1 Ala-tRNA(Pro) deacylase [Planomicrobium soli]
MFFVSDVMNTAPTAFQSPLQEKAYESLDKLLIPFERVETDEAISMEDCVEINRKLEMEMVKTLFLCNSKKSAFYLFITNGEKSFKSKDFSSALGISRVSFAPVELMESILGVKIGAATVFSLLMDTDKQVQVVVDQDVVTKEWYGCSDGTTTGYLKLKTKDIIDNFLPHAGYIPRIIKS